jgi:hypothetical membrane protein
MKKPERLAGISGILAVIVLLVSLLFFGFSNNDFSFINDFISKLGAKGEPNAFWFNLMAFAVVGVLLVVFGLSYGLFLKDSYLCVLLSLFGIGFAFTAIPIDLQMPNAPVSKAHIIAICLGLASWMFGLSRLGYNVQIEKRIRNKANLAAILLFLSMIGFALGLWSMPTTHRLVFGIVFGWTALTSLSCLQK